MKGRAIFKPILMTSLLLSGLPEVSAAQAVDSEVVSKTPEEMVPPVDRTGSQTARDAVAQARLAHQRARSALGAVERFVESQIRTTGGFKELRFDVQQKRLAWHQLQRPILDLLQQDEDYAKLNQEKETARQIIQDLFDDQKADYLTVLPHAKQALEAGKKMTRKQVIALALDPAVEDARLVFIESNNRLRAALDAARKDALQSPAMQIARQEVESCRRRIDEARAQLDVALAREAAAELRRADKVEAIRKQRQIVETTDKPKERPKSKPD
jgi:hypothetical protein